MLKNLQQIPQQLLPNLTIKKSPSNRNKPPKLHRYGRYLHWRLIRMRGTPEYIARGLALGVFAGLFPIFGLQTIVGIALATLFRGHKIAAAAGTWVSNPLTYLPIYAINFQVGRWLLNSQEEFVPESILSFPELMQYGTQFVTSLFLGCLVMGIIGGILSYFVGLKLIRWWRSNRRQNLENNLY
ncbi:MAG: DUF2062 domain-containing protein [Okeania sp. SIO2F4]|uniref:DUF2062 domain-containing protein n=1 Tax=Okeania sp. SIO2F4 TaxID=2607790 RepID=UPI00142CC70E|nr:DUF2062 domain-containing protein [Okeania sp. SIO2F4]NES03673.1 DUF2062 domain-containing protein [Okeania sp. SIO2F4]